MTVEGHAFAFSAGERMRPHCLRPEPDVEADRQRAGCHAAGVCHAVRALQWGWLMIIGSQGIVAPSRSSRTTTL